MDQGLALFANVLENAFVNWLILMHCEQVRVNFARVCSAVTQPPPKGYSLQSCLFQVSHFETSMKVFRNSIYDVIFSVLNRSEPA